MSCEEHHTVVVVVVVFGVVGGGLHVPIQIDLGKNNCITVLSASPSHRRLRRDSIWYY
jgi:hypothetical protein